MSTSSVLTGAHLVKEKKIMRDISVLKNNNPLSSLSGQARRVNCGRARELLSLELSCCLLMFTHYIVIQW